MRSNGAIAEPEVARPTAYSRRERPNFSCQFLGTFPKSIAYPAYRQNLPIEFNQAYDRLTARKDKEALRMKK